METKIKRPEVVKDEHLEFLNILRESGITNMFGAGQYLREEFEELSKAESNTVLMYWMKSF